MHADVVVEGEDPPQGFLVQRHAGVQALPVAAGQRFEALLAAERGFAEQPGGLRGDVGDQFDFLGRLARGEGAAFDVAVDVEAIVLACRRVEQFGAPDAVQGELAQVVVVVDGGDQIADRVARDQSGGMQAQGLGVALAAAAVVDAQLAIFDQGGGYLFPDLRLQRGG